MLDIYKTFINLNYKKHLLLSLSIRLCLIIYGIYQDQFSKVPYTDIDYKVFTDASRHIFNNNSPYDRHTYRYTPLVAMLLLPNIFFNNLFGKILFSCMDLVVAVLIRTIIKKNLEDYDKYCKKIDKKTENSNFYGKSKQILGKTLKCNEFDRNVSKNNDFIANSSMLVWLYNPLTIAIGTRGNCDSLSVFFVLLTLYFLQCQHRYFISGLIHGVSVHFRLYPLIYSLALYMFLSTYSFYITTDSTYTYSNNKINSRTKIKNIAKSKKREGSIEKNNMLNEHKTLFKKQYLLYLVPNLNQLNLIAGCLVSLMMLTGLFYYIYGYKFLFETYIYHLIRKDTRHNFSLFFYLQYLTARVKNIGAWQKLLMVLPQFILLLIFSCRYGLNRFSLNFCILSQTFVMVIYNSVLTSQYFVWVMAILPLCLWQIKISKITTTILIIIWFSAQGAWLLPAYLLEFLGQNTFFFIWVQSVSFFCANIAILGRLISNFSSQIDMEVSIKKS